MSLLFYIYLVTNCSEYFLCSNKMGNQFHLSLYKVFNFSRVCDKNTDGVTFDALLLYCMIC